MPLNSEYMQERAGLQSRIRSLNPCIPESLNP